MIGRVDTVVDEKNIAKTMGSGDLPVYATPALVALMEEAACKAIASDLEENMTTVGTMIQVKHVAATPQGVKVWAQAKMIEKEGRKYRFMIEAFDEKGLIGTGEHERVAVDREKFLKRTMEKKEV